MLFGSPGKGNTQDVVKTVIQAARERKIKQIVVASVTGYSAREFLSYAEEFRIISVGYGYYITPGIPNAMSEDTQNDLRAGGIHLLFGTHVLSGAEHHLRTKYGGTYPVDIMAHTLSIFGPGVKVGIECVIAALDAGLILPVPTIGVGGSGDGADAAVVVTPESSIRILDTKVHEILCKPSYYPAQA